MKRAIATVCMPGTLAEKLSAAAEAGYQGVEIFENDLTYFDGRPEDVRTLAASLGLEIIALQPFRDFEGLPEPLRAKALERARRKFELMGRLGTPLLLVCSSLSPEAVDDMARIAADLHELGELARQFGVSVGFEALAWGRHINDYRQAWEAVRRADHAQVGLILDSFHMLARRLPVDAIAGIPAERIVLVQTADAPGIEMDLLFLSRHYRCFPGQGDLPVAAMMRKLDGIGYRGPVSHEIFSDDFRASSTRRIALDGMRSFLWLGEQVRGAADPPLPAIDGIEFVELVDRPDPSSALIDMLHGLGFRRTHRHRSKRVELYRQGEVNLVLNLEEEGFPHAFYLLHGLSVAALALRVDDAGRARARAAAMLARPFVGPIGEGELEIPAVRGVSGSLVYFVEARPDGQGRFLEIDFAPDPEPEEPSDLGLLRIDHVAQVVPEAELLGWVLYYRAILGLEPAERTDLPDPHGLIVSRALRNADRTLRIALNVSQAERTAAGRFLQQTAGAGAQHIAFACRDIFAAAAALPPELKLPIPDNYYDDLAARFDLDEGVLDRMRRHSILYDRIGGGEFFQLFTRSLNGLFFELVERRGYDRYGEANAPVRLAAQAALERSAAEIMTALRG